MENMKNLNFAEMSDNELNSVSGGAKVSKSIEIGDRVKAADGRACPNCGGKIGTVEMLNYTTKVIKCEKCKKHIMSFTDSNQVVKV